MPILLTLRYTLQPLRGEAAASQYECKWNHQAIADCLQKGDKRVEFLKSSGQFTRESKTEIRGTTRGPDS